MNELIAFVVETSMKILFIFVGKTRLRIISKVTGLILAAMSAQMIITGIRNSMMMMTTACEAL